MSGLAAKRTSDHGIIPSGSTKRSKRSAQAYVRTEVRYCTLKKSPERVMFFYFFADACETNFASLDFLRSAVFFLITPRFAALSIAL
jgi:hypothetical protein